MAKKYPLRKAQKKAQSFICLFSICSHLFTLFLMYFELRLIVSSAIVKRFSRNGLPKPRTPTVGWRRLRVLVIATALLYMPQIF